MFKLLFKYSVWATCKAKASFSEQNFHSEVLLGDAPLKCNGQKSIPVSMSVNPPFPTHHSSISLCFHHLHHATCNSPAFKSTILSSRWSPQFTHWQTCTCPLSKGVGRGHQGEWYLPVEPLCTYYCQLCTFLCFWCALEHIQSKRERQHSILTGPVFCAWHFRQMWEPTAFCENHVKLVHMMGSSSAQGDTRMSYCDVLQCTFLQCTFLWSPVSPLCSRPILYDADCLGDT